MADLPISGLPAVVTPALTDLYAIAQSGTTKKETGTQLQTLMLTNGNVTGYLHFPNTGLKIFDTNATNYLTIVAGSNLTADRNLNILTGDSNRDITMGGDLAFADDFTTVGNFPVTQTYTGNTSVTFPTSGTLATTSDLGAYLPLAGGAMSGDIVLDNNVAIKTDTTSGHVSNFQAYRTTGSPGYVTFGSLSNGPAPFMGFINPVPLTSLLFMRSLTGLSVENASGFELFFSSIANTTGNRFIRYDTNDGDVSFNLTGDITLDDWFDQGVKTTDSPTFDNVSLTTGTVSTLPSAGDDITNKTYVDSVSGGITPISNLRYIGLNGDDANDGSIGSPYLTLAGAYAGITTASSVNPFKIIMATGNYTFATVTPKPNILVDGQGSNLTITNPVTLDASWAGDTGIMGFMNFSQFVMTGGISLDFTAATATRATVYLSNLTTLFASTWHFKGLNGSTVDLFLANINQSSGQPTVTIENCYYEIFNCDFFDLNLTNTITGTNYIGTLNGSTVYHNFSQGVSGAGSLTTYTMANDFQGANAISASGGGYSILIEGGNLRVNPWSLAGIQSLLETDRIGELPSLSGGATLGQVTYTSLTSVSTARNNLGLGTSNSPTFAGVSLTNGTISSAPSGSTDIVNKAYADAIAAGVQFLDASYCATTATLTATYLNGASGVGATLTNSGALAAFSVDGITPPVNSLILVKNQSSAFQNGLYTLTVAGSGAVAWVLTRSTHYDQITEILPGTLIPIEFGSTLGGSSWVQTATVTVIGTDAINFSEFSYPASTANTANTVVLRDGSGGFSAGSATLSNVLGLGILNFNGANCYIEPSQGNGDILYFYAYDLDATTYVSWCEVHTGNTPAVAIHAPVGGTITIDGPVGSVTPNTGVFTSATATSMNTTAANTWTKAQRYSFTTLTDAATVAIDMSLSNNFNLTLGGNRTLDVPTNMVAGQSGIISVRQDITGTRTLAYAWVYMFPGGIAPTLSTGKLVFDQLYYSVNSYSTATVTVTIATPAVMTWTAHGLVSGQRIQLTTTGALPTGLTASTTYWVTVINANTFNLSSSLANAQTATFIATSGSQSGTHTAVNASVTISNNLGIA